MHKKGYAQKGICTKRDMHKEGYAQRGICTKRDMHKKGYAQKGICTKTVTIIGGIDMYKDESGYMVVETIGSFILFMLLMASILSLVNIVTLQARVHYALTQTANTLSMYNYTLHVTGMAEHMMKSDAIASEVEDGVREFKKDINAVLDGINRYSLSDVAEHGEAVANRVIGVGEGIADDPEKAMEQILNYGLSQVGSAVFGGLVRPLVGRYLSNGRLSGEGYLNMVNVIGGLEGLNFYEFTLPDLSKIEQHNSILLDRHGDVKLAVQYEVKYKFGRLPLPFEPKLKITQTVRTKAWLGGRGDGYRYE